MRRRDERNLHVHPAAEAGNARDLRMELRRRCTATSSSDANRRSTRQWGIPQRALTVLSPKKEISRSHCEVRVTGWDVRLRDLGSNNGTFLIRPGQGPLRVSESSPVIVKIGDVIDLGEGVTIRMES